MFYLKIADLVIRIENRYDYSEIFCRGFQIYGVKAEDCSLHIAVSDQEIETQMQLAVKRGRRIYPAWYYENIAIQRRLCQELLRYDALFVHSALLCVDGAGYALCAGVHGGKSTQAAIWLKLFGSRAVCINGDKPVYRLSGKTLTGYGTPWMGKEASGTNQSVPVKAFFFLKKGTENRAKRLNGPEILSRLFYHLELPADENHVREMEQLLISLLPAVSFFELECTKSPEAARIALAASGDLKSR